MNQTNEKQIEEINPKEELEALAEAIMGGGIFLVTVAVLGNILRLLQDPIYLLVSSIRNILTIILGESAAILVLLAIILFIAAGIVKLGTFLKDEEEQRIYMSSIYLAWFIGLILFFLLGVGYLIGLVSEALIISAGFMLVIAPLIAFAIFKGITFLLSRFSQ